MSVQSSEAFLRIAYKTPSVAQQLKATTGIQEIVRLGERHGYDFSINDFMEAASFFRPENAPPRPEPAPAPTSTTFLHHEYRLEDVPGFEPVIAELPQLKVQPPTVDLAQFHHSYRADDEATTSMSPADPTFQQWHAAMMKEGWQDPSRGHGGPRRDFHLINLDEHTEHPSYEAYFDAKTRTIAALENLFDSEIKFSGSMWYPPHSYRLWHTNETQPGWRMRSRKPPRTGRSAMCRCCSTRPFTREPPRRRKCLPLTFGRSLRTCRKGSRCVSRLDVFASRQRAVTVIPNATPPLSQPSPFGLCSG
jgi:hypothetical protein